MKTNFVKCSWILTWLLPSVVVFSQSSVDDPTWNPGETGAFVTGFTGTQGGIFTAINEPDGSIMVVGGFDRYNFQQNIRWMARVSSTGVLDATFSTGTGFAGQFTAETGSPGVPTPMNVVRLSDGSYMVVGNFRTYQGIDRAGVVKIKSNGEIDNSFNGEGAGANGVVTCIMPVRGGKFMIGGSFNTYNGTSVTRLARLNANGTLDETFNAGGSGANLVVYGMDTLSNGNLIVVGTLTTFNGTPVPRIVQLDQNGEIVPFQVPIANFNTFIRDVKVRQPGDKIIISGAFSGSGLGRISAFLPTGEVDPDFKWNGGFNSDVYRINFDADGKILVAGNFTQYQDKTIKRFIRLMPNGEVDESFNPNGYGTGSYNFQGTLRVLLGTGNGKYFVGGSFREYELCVYQGGMQILANGMPDPAFSPATGAAAGSGWQSPGFFNASDNISPRVLAIKYLPSGKSIVAGEFTRWGNMPRRFIARLNTDGSLDNDFLSNGFIAPNFKVTTVDVQTDRKVIIGGDFLTYGGINRPNVARLNEDGTLDESFFPLNAVNGRAAGTQVVKVLSSEKILVGGNFQAFNLDNTKRCLVRLNSDGTIDNDFAPPLFTSGTISSLLEMPDGKILVGGSSLAFSVNGTNYSSAGLIRLNADGSFDNTFNNGTVQAIAINGIDLAGEGKVFVTGGFFMQYGGQTRRGIFKINADGTADNTFLGPQQNGSWEFSAAYTMPNGNVAAVGNYMVRRQGINFDQVTSGVAVLNANGTAVLSFLATGSDLSGTGTNVNLTQVGFVLASQFTPAGILVGGDFSRSGTTPRINLTRLIPDGFTLPVTWQSFTAQEVQGNALLQWTTASEQRNKGFYIERSANGNDYTTLGFVPAMGNGNSILPTRYTYTDAKPPVGVQFYRLRQTDTDGSFAYSEVRKVVIGMQDAAAIYPNPVPASFTLVPTATGTCTLSYMDASGRVVAQHTLATQAGMAAQVRRPVLPKGVYWIQLEYANNKVAPATMRIMIQ